MGSIFSSSPGKTGCGKRKVRDGCADEERITPAMADAFFPGCPPFRIVHGRGQTVRFSISGSGGFVVSVPLGFDMGRLQVALRERREWICRHWERLCARPIPVLDVAGRQEREWNRDAWPKCLDLACTGEHFGVRYVMSSGAPSVRETPGVLTVRHPEGDWETAREALAAFLKRKAKRCFGPRLEALALQKNLPPPRRMRVACQRTRWGSRSSQGTISLNACLLFLHDREAEYVLCHELCHGVHMNHSARFWALLERAFPEARKMDRELTGGWKKIPAWFVPSVIG